MPSFYRCSTMWKYTLNHREVIKKGICCIFGNGEMVNFWYDIWLKESTLIHEIPKFKIKYYRYHKGKLLHWNNKTWNISKLRDFLVLRLLKFINRQIGQMMVLLLGIKVSIYLYMWTSIQNKIIWKLILKEKLLVKIAIWENNYKISPHPRTKLLNHIWKLNLILISNYLRELLLG